MAESTGRKGEIGKLPPPRGSSVLAGKASKDKLARLYQRECNSGEDDVILSFGGSDDSFGFADSLHRCLVADGIRVLSYDDHLCTLPEELRPSVSGSKIYVTVFSRTYADSPRCLETLALMIEHTSSSGGKKEILPVFYDVQRSDVNMEKESLYKAALDSHGLWFGPEKVKEWKKALVEAGKV